MKFSLDLRWQRYVIRNNLTESSLYLPWHQGQGAGGGGGGGLDKKKDILNPMHSYLRRDMFTMRDEKKAY